MSDLVKRLRESAEAWDDCGELENARFEREAADRIEELEGNFAALDAALRKTEAQRDGYIQEGMKMLAHIQALEAELEESRQATGGMLLGCIRRGEMSRSEIAALAQGKVRLPISAFNRKAVRRAYAASLVASLQPVSTSEAK